MESPLSDLPASSAAVPKVSYVATYVPRRCGIATFCADVRAGVLSAGQRAADATVVAINGPMGQRFDYPPEVKFEVERDRRQDYRLAADFINYGQSEVICLQHEYGIYGGEAGIFIADLLANVNRPVVTAMHTVLEDPEDPYRLATERLVAGSAAVVAISQRGADLLAGRYGVARDAISVIPHGAPDVPFVDPNFAKGRFGVEGRHVLMTFGLLGPGKGIETALEAYAHVVEEFPKSVFIILGATHPEVRRRQGEQYRVGLQNQVEQLGLANNVVFINRYVDTEELCAYLSAADVYVVPYPNRQQAVSGTLTYAVALGKAVISTPFWHAEELLAEDRGILVPFSDPQAMAAAMRELLGNEMVRAGYRTRAYNHGRQFIWKRVGSAYADLFRRVGEREGHRVRVAAVHAPIRTAEVLPDINLDHMVALTDSTGILQHAKFTTPDRCEGYCTDDNARALLVAIENHDVFDDEDRLHLVTRYLAFLNHAQRPDGRFHNFMTYQRMWIPEDPPSEDSLGRALWALGVAVRDAHAAPQQLLAKSLFDRALPNVTEYRSLRAAAYTIIGLHAYLGKFGGASDCRRTLEHLVEFLVTHYTHNAKGSWRWFEQTMTYGNARLPHALLLAGQTLQRSELIDIAIESLEFLWKIHYTGRHISLIGNDGWYVRGGKRAQFDQQPVDAGALVDAFAQAVRSVGPTPWIERMKVAFQWFLGRNDLGQTLYDFQSGGCCDGLEAQGVNHNQGAESTLCWLMALGRMHSLADRVARRPHVAAAPLQLASSSS